MTTQRGIRTAAAGALLLVGVGVGAAVAVTAGASAESGTPTKPATPSAGADPNTGPERDPSRPQRPDEELLTGDTAAKVTAAVKARYPGATIERVETDSEGVYEGHIVTADGEHLVVQVGKDFTVTGTQTGGGRGDHGGRRHNGDHDGDGPRGPRGPGGPDGPTTGPTTGPSSSPSSSAAPS